MRAKNRRAAKANQLASPASTSQGEKPCDSGSSTSTSCRGRGREGAELQLFQEALDQVELADRLGIDYAWEVEHHFLEEYSHSSAPEVFLAACSQRTKRIRLGHGIVLMPPRYNHPARVAERIATLDLVSNGRVDFGTGRVAPRARSSAASASTRDEKRAMWREATEQMPQHAGDGPLPRLRGQVLLDALPQRRAEAGAEAAPAALGGVLATARRSSSRRGSASARSPSPSSTRARRSSGWTTTTRPSSDECVPIGHAVNPNIAMVAGFSCHADERGGAPPRPRRLPLLRLRARPPLHLRRAQAGPHRHLGALREGARRPARDTPARGGIGTPDELARPPARASRTRASTR